MTQNIACIRISDIGKKLFICVEVEFPLEVSSCLSDSIRNTVGFALISLIYVSRNNDLPAGLTDAFELVQRLIRLVQKMDHIRRDDRIKTPVRVGEAENIRLIEPNVAVFFIFLFRPLQHLCGKSVAIRLLQRGST